MATSSSATACNSAPRLRSVATLVRLTGRVGAANRDLVLAHLHRFTLVQGALVLDLLDGDGIDGDFAAEVVDAVDRDTDVTLVVRPELIDAVAADGRVDAVGSVGEALHDIAERIRTRRAFVTRSVAGQPALRWESEPPVTGSPVTCPTPGRPSRGPSPTPPASRSAR